MEAAWKEQVTCGTVNMKLCLLILASFVTAVMAKGPPLFLPPQAKVPDSVLNKFMEKAALKKTCVPALQEVPKGATSFEIGGVTVNMVDLRPKDIFSPGAEVIIDGVKQSPKVYVYSPPGEPWIRVVLDDSMDLIAASAHVPNGEEVDLVRVSGTTFAEVKTDDIDPDMISDYELGMEDSLEIGTRRNLRQRLQHQNMRQLSTLTAGPICTQTAKASMYVIADSDFVQDAKDECDICNVTDNKKAEAAIQMIFDDVKDVYIRDLCVDLSLKGYFIVTDKDNDDYKNMRESSTNICGGSGYLIHSFRTYTKNTFDPSGGDRTFLHLFYGAPNATGSRTIGCAYTKAMCNTEWGVAVNEASYRGLYSSSAILKRNIVAHETGHLCGMNHTTDMMADGISSSNPAEYFGSVSIEQGIRCLNGIGCDNSCFTISDPTPVTTTTTTSMYHASCLDMLTGWLLDHTYIVFLP